ncbi:MULTISPECIES: 5-dehydro-4-deoxy-D-glucuronate isomerase [unclassified Rathayibacter]|uniref:5-dehydro-4-deoxy-D-glucuronate isomerase n=1 Tax=unclassified Rathayibacter TaxID=2609250 RepID=UPI0010496ACD|nr:MULTISPECIES: 5-dehydro-4-deoxy-D-glucuronate isomerase [unclassified Rathayibacter]TCL86090.1 4-deoxy-L-threo-5-hexulose uronate isomerase [Rathayibacter sp. PhB192]TCM31911.1 4-deoxy-L-threo-5-hexulose uronate isomerase [Rathayibacter sp. PhB179]
MEQRYATNPSQIPGMTTEDLRREYLVPDVFVAGEITLVYTHHDRIVLGGAVPAGQRLELTGYEEIRSDTFLEHRELGIVNVGGTGTVTADGETYTLVSGACLYLGRGIEAVAFEDAGSGDVVSGDAGAQFYLFSAPAHTTYPSVLVAPGEGTVRELGEQATSNRRTLNQYIHENGVRSCQIVMGVTTLHEGSMWNTMPAHTHDRRTECYLYFDLPEDARVIHLLGERQETRHLVVADRQAILSPSWSLHSGVGTAAYSFVWAMAGENQAFDDMDAAPVKDLA